jgi:formylglycine-generating enzyme required for sulfatase activity
VRAVPTVVRWTGREAACLRMALRLTLIDFSQRVGVTDRMVSKWEAGAESIAPRLGNQRALDTVLATASRDEQERFAAILTATAAAIPDPRTEALLMSDETDSRVHPVDGKLMVLIGEGLFLSGSDNARLWLPGYWIDVFPTTNRDYEGFVSATGRTPPPHWGGDTCPPSVADHPVVCVTWHDASAYAAWAVKELPTSQQWEKAARGAAGDPFPWVRIQKHWP